MLPIGKSSAPSLVVNDKGLSAEWGVKLPFGKERQHVTSLNISI